MASYGSRIAPEKPTIFTGSRGVLNFTMRLNLHAGTNHSGNWGGLLTNPGVVMAHALASTIDCMAPSPWIFEEFVDVFTAMVSVLLMIRPNFYPPLTGLSLSPVCVITVKSTG